MMKSCLIGVRRLTTGKNPNYGFRLDKKNTIKILRDIGIDYTDIHTSQKFDSVVSNSHENIESHVLISFFAKGQSLKAEYSIGKFPEWRDKAKELYLFNPKIELQAQYKWIQDTLYIHITDPRFTLQAAAA